MEMLRQYKPERWHKWLSRRRSIWASVENIPDIERAICYKERNGRSGCVLCLLKLTNSYRKYNILQCHSDIPNTWRTCNTGFEGFNSNRLLSFAYLNRFTCCNSLTHSHLLTHLPRHSLTHSLTHTHSLTTQSLTHTHSLAVHAW
jgi:hypothetical protein